MAVSGIQLLNDGRTLTFDVEQESDAASAIQISGIRLSISRMVPEGELNANIYVETPFSKTYEPLKNNNRMATLSLGWASNGCI